MSRSPKPTELLYDKYVAAEKLKNGTKYERLAAIVFSVLEEQSTIHDLRLRGSSGIKHQIDAVVGPDHRRILIEAKEYKTKIGLGIVRDFFGVVEDIRPASAYVVSTEGFTRDAIKYAKAKSIRLAVLRPPRDGDLDDIIQRIVLNIQATSFRLERVAIEAPDGEEAALGMVSLEEVWLGTEHERTEPFRDQLERAYLPAYQAVPHGEARQIGGVVRFNQPTWLHALDRAPVQVVAFEWAGQTTVATITSEVGGDRIAELILADVDGKARRAFTDKDLTGWSFAA